MANSKQNPQLESLLQCGMWLDKYNDPRALPCLHSFCLGCRKQHIPAKKASYGSFHCPKCRDQFTPPEADAGKFPKNFFLHLLKDVSMFTSQHLEQPEEPTQCTTHKNKPDWYCQSWNPPGCAECKARDHRLHETGEMANIASKLEPDLLVIFKRAAKRLENLHSTLTSVKSEWKRRQSKLAEKFPISSLRHGIFL